MLWIWCFFVYIYGHKRFISVLVLYLWNLYVKDITGFKMSDRSIHPFEVLNTSVWAWSTGSCNHKVVNSQKCWTGKLRVWHTGVVTSIKRGQWIHVLDVYFRHYSGKQTVLIYYYWCNVQGWNAICKQQVYQFFFHFTFYVNTNVFTHLKMHSLFHFL